MPARDPDFDAEAELATWTPDLASEEHAPLIRSLAAETRPPNRAGARSVAGILSGFVYWAEQTGRPVDAETLLDKAVIDSYVVAAPGSIAPATRQHYRTVLRRVARAHQGRTRHRAVAGRLDAQRPYTPTEVDALLLWAQNQPSTRRADALLALLVLGLGAGLDGTDVSLVRGTDVRQDDLDGPVFVDVRRDGAPRRVPALVRYETELLRLAAAAGPGWIVNPTLDPWAKGAGNLVPGQVKRAQPAHDAPGFLQSRTRITWVCHHLAAGTRLDVLVKAGGYKHADGIARYARYLDHPGDAAATEMLRHA